jgi:DNA polymerase-3 subunit delta'
LSLLHANDEEHPFEQWFVTWVRAAFQQKNASAIHDLILWVKNCRIRKRQKFLQFCIEMFRQALMMRLRH